MKPIVGTSLKYIAGLAGALLVALLLAAPGSAQDPPYEDWNPALPGFPSKTPDSARANCAGGGDQCIERTIGEMWRRFHRVVPGCDHNNLFSLTYLRVTEDIRTAVDEGFYPDLQWINQQDAMFARTYFLAYDNWRAGRTELVPESWRVAFDAGRDQSVQGLGNLLLSMNAHVNRDFPFILFHVGLVNEDGSSKKPDHDAYNARLRALYEPMLTELAERFDESIDDYNVPGTTSDDDAFFSLLTQWRESAWQYATQLAAAQNNAERRSIAREIEQNANGWAQSIRAGAAYGPGQGPDTRNARCAEFGGQQPGYKRGSDVASVVGGAQLSGSGRLVVRLRCPNGPGPCRGTVKLRRPRKAGAPGPDGLELIGRQVFEIPAGKRLRLRVPVARRGALLAHPARGVWVAARSKLGYGVAVNKRRKAGLSITG